MRLRARARWGISCCAAVADIAVEVCRWGCVRVGWGYVLLVVSILALELGGYICPWKLGGIRKLRKVVNDIHPSRHVMIVSVMSK